MTHTSWIIALGFGLSASGLLAKDIHVSTSAKPKGDGSEETPYKDLKSAFTKAKPGDHVILHGGRYFIPTTLKNVKGSANKPIRVSAKAGANVILDGSDSLKSLQWKQAPNIPGTFVAKLDKPISQLFSGDKMLTAARWPNAHMTDENFFNKRETLRAMKQGQSPFGKVADEDTANLRQPRNRLVQPLRDSRKNSQSLADSGIHAQGCIAIMNIGSWQNYASRVMNHKKGSSSFNYDKTFSESGELAKLAKKLAPSGTFGKMLQGKYWHGHYYMLEGLACLDAENEYWYDKDSKKLYLKPPKGKHPSTMHLRGKRRNYMLDMHNCEHIILDHINFFGATFRMHYCQHVTLQNSELKCPSYNEFQLGNLGKFPVTEILNTHSKKSNIATGNVVRNCRFSYLDGDVLSIRGRDTILENCLFHDLQYSCLGFGWAMMIDKSIVRRCTIYRNGAAQGFRSGRIIEYSRVSESGGLQHDGACYQASGRDNVVFRYNWAHDVYDKLAFRFDSGSNPAESNAYGQVYKNVAWNCGEYQIKGDDHILAHNIAISGSSLGLNTQKIYKSTNKRTVCYNNLTKAITASQKDPVPGDKKNNILSEDATDYLVAPWAGDFRPQLPNQTLGSISPVNPSIAPRGFPTQWINNKHFSSADCVGAYGKSNTVYLIPGFQDSVASSPVPFSGSSKLSTNTPLMFLHAYQSSSAAVYFSQSKEEVTSNKSSARIATLKAPQNMVFPEDMQKGTRYYWRVRSAFNNGKVTDGPVWSFVCE